MGTQGKWISGLTFQSSIEEAGRRSLLQRLEHVHDCFTMAAFRPRETANRDIELVHRLRVATRRAAAAMELYSDLLPKRRNRKNFAIRTRLKQIRGAAGDARDLDVFAERLRKEDGAAELGILEELFKRRKRAQRQIRSVFKEAYAPESFQAIGGKGRRRTTHFRRQIDELVNAIRPRGKRSNQLTKQPLGDWAKHELANSAARFVKATPEKPYYLDALHRFRIRGKALRYAIELVSVVLDSQIREFVYPVIQELQERLGTINDCAVSYARLSDWVETAGDKARERFFAKFLKRERRRCDAAIKSFAHWWTPELSHWITDSLMDPRETTIKPKRAAC